MASLLLLLRNSEKTVEEHFTEMKNRLQKKSKQRVALFKSPTPKDKVPVDKNNDTELQTGTDKIIDKEEKLIDPLVEVKKEDLVDSTDMVEKADEEDEFSDDI